MTETYIMSSNEPMWRRHRIDEAGLSIEVYQPWPLDSWVDGDGGTIYQPVADTSGSVFLSYGEKETLEDFTSSLSDFITSASLISDEELVYCGHNARRKNFVSIRQSLREYHQDPVAGLTDGLAPEARTIVSVISFTNKGIPILVGYRVPEESLPTYQSVLERIINSVEML